MKTLEVVFSLWGTLTNTLKTITYESAKDLAFEHYIISSIILCVIIVVIFLFISFVCGILFLLIVFKRLNKYGRFTKGYPINLFVEQMKKNLGDKKLEDTDRPSKEKVEKLMEVSRFSHPEYLKESYDAIIIGSGLSGLATAGFLSKAGKKCLILEEHDRFGGCCHVYEENGHEFCSGIHFLNGYTPMLEWSLQILTNSQIQVESIEDVQKDVFQFPSKRIELDGHQSIDRLSKYLPTIFPHEKKSLEKFFFHANKCLGSYRKFIGARSTPFPINVIMKYILNHEKRFNHYGQFTAVEMMNKCGIKDKILRSLLTVNQGLVSSHHQDKFIFPMCVLFLDIGWKKSRIVGGGGIFPKLIISNLENESKAIHHTKVKKIIPSSLNNNNSKGSVELESGEKIFADVIVSSTGIQSTNNMLPKNIQKNLILGDLMKKFEYTGFHFLVHLGLDIPSKKVEEEIGMDHNHSCFFGLDDRGEIQKKMKELKPPNFDGFEECYEISCCLDINKIKNEKEGQKQENAKITVMMSAFPEWFDQFKETESGKRGREYEEWKENLSKKILDIVYSEYPKLEEHINYIDTSTNLTTRDFLKSPQGSGYGLDLSFDKIDSILGNKKVFNPLKGIYIVGQDLMGDGIMPTVMSCFYAVGDIIGRNFFMDFQKARDFKEKNK